ncbi:hypothetical protein BU204_21915 [Actinophytocola xanthii]|uniref:Uncharacterized protein n=1 Tax=Actinophytocola xanthii TaxID=1912961 RepID=A0A1Q8CM71_9PSEU|nr:hypothetical protein BU204_21915 [Actinophytocola xanthii]
MRALVARGFRFIDPRDEHGEVVAVVGIRAHHSVVDVVELHGEDEALACRMPANEDVLAPRRVFWREAGPANEVLAMMLATPDEHLGDLVPRPATPPARRRRGAAVGLQTH